MTGGTCASLDCQQAEHPSFPLQEPSAGDRICPVDFVGAVHYGIGFPSLADAQVPEKGPMDDFSWSGECF